VTEDQPASAVEHLQRAAAELFAAGHATLDSLQEMVGTSGVGQVVAGVGKLAETLLDAVADAMAPGAGPSAEEAADEPRGAPGRPGVEHIPVD
jgi:hypothetical protein